MPETTRTRSRPVHVDRVVAVYEDRLWRATELEKKKRWEGEETDEIIFSDYSKLNLNNRDRSQLN